MSVANHLLIVAIHDNKKYEHGKDLITTTLTTAIQQFDDEKYESALTIFQTINTTNNLFKAKCFIGRYLCEDEISRKNSNYEIFRYYSKSINLLFDALEAYGSRYCHRYYIKLLQQYILEIIFEMVSVYYNYYKDINLCILINRMIHYIGDFIYIDPIIALRLLDIIDILQKRGLIWETYNLIQYMLPHISYSNAISIDGSLQICCFNDEIITSTFHDFIFYYYLELIAISKQEINRFLWCFDTLHYNFAIGLIRNCNTITEFNEFKIKCKYLITSSIDKLLKIYQIHNF